MNFSALLLLLLSCTLLVAPAPAGAAPAVEPKKVETPAEKLRKALDQIIDLDMADQSLAQAVNQLREQTKINFVLDRFLLQSLGMDPEHSPVTVKLQKVTVRSALRTLLATYNLGFGIVGETVLISTDEIVMQRQLRQRVNLDLDQVELATALKRLSQETGANLTVDVRVHKEAKTEVSLQLEDVPLETAVRLLTELAGLKPVRSANVLFVTSKDRAAQLRGDPDFFDRSGPNPNERMRRWVDGLP